MSDEKRYRECMAEITGILKKYDMAGAVTVVSKERAMFKFHFPTWSVISLDGNCLRFRSKREDFPSKEAQQEATELSAHIIMQFRDIAANTLTALDGISRSLRTVLDIDHTPGADFDPERDN